MRQRASERERIKWNVFLRAILWRFRFERAYNIGKLKAHLFSVSVSFMDRRTAVALQHGSTANMWLISYSNCVKYFSNVYLFRTFFLSALFTFPPCIRRAAILRGWTKIIQNIGLFACFFFSFQFIWLRFFLPKAHRGTRKSILNRNQFWFFLSVFMRWMI